MVVSAATESSRAARKNCKSGALPVLHDEDSECMFRLCKERLQKNGAHWGRRGASRQAASNTMS